jgi:putative ABC transport system ATP-binding protein
MYLFETRALCKFYRIGSRAEVRALQDVTAQIPPKSFTVLTGPSGSGKTTLLALLGYLERPTSGQVVFAGKDLSTCSDVELSRARRRLGFVFQDFALIRGLPVWENVTYPLVPRGRSGRERYQLAGQLLARVGLAERMTSRPAELSGGEQQRVAVARALAAQPEVILADEPTSNLDDAAGAAVIELLREANAQGTTVIASSHDARLQAIATERFVLAGGRLSTRGT